MVHGDNEVMVVWIRGKGELVVEPWGCDGSMGQDTSGSSSIWPTSMWSLKPDLQALSSAAIGKPIFDGLPKPITGRKNKAALD